MSVELYRQHRIALLALSLLHVVIIAASNYLVQFPFTLLGIHTTWGAFSFPFIFLATDLTVRVFGKQLARQIILRVMLPALLISYVISVIFAEGRYIGAEGMVTFNLAVARIALASFIAYLIGQLLDIQVFDRLRQYAAWWIAPVISTILGNLADTLAFFSVAFYQGPNEFMAQHWFEIALVDYGFKLFISLAFFIPAYGALLSLLQERLIAQKQTSLLGNEQQPSIQHDA
ncbi:hypothetical protein BFW38_07025 [Terasakiispira papahanaumokuakeensis]|uniref:Probable queuosine precursor transporter n=1 Tax=Terasakiispira papahanaumokuakeensis TaxID=197479 RepID=A0A1E2V944_9GAMM|nr:7-cyano-7-deazaguanine/7-aminomethyl-7-deazaguanine transporter [Terasakiispira papahanaumokuakeensis]ODC03336.1 hypothetical protein BFW38_07025 [Terasakiispira papahanaumokuakeensis]